MKELNKTKSSGLKKGNLSCARKPADSEIISLPECRGYFKGANISESMMKIVRNNLVGVVDSVINTYLEEFR